MQRKDVERLTDDCILASKALCDTGTFETGQAILGEAAAALSALLAERDALQGQLNDLRNGWAKSVKAHAALLAERDALRAAIFGGTDYATDLTNGNFVEMAQTTEAARLGALARAEKAEAERDAAFAAGQEEMRERAAEQCDCALMDWEGDVLHDRARAIRDLPIKLRPE